MSFPNLPIRMPTNRVGNGHAPRPPRVPYTAAPSVISTLPPVAPLAPITENYLFEHHHLLGVNGWRPTSMAGFDPVPPVMVVHDLLEHFAEGTSDVYWEYMALGAALWLRHEGRFFRHQKKYFDREIAFAVAKPFFTHITERQLPADVADPILGGREPLDNVNTEMELLSTVSRMRRAALKLHFNIHDVDAILYPAAEWMRIGYRRAVDRYAASIPSPTVLSKMFGAAVQAIEAKTQTALLNDPMVLTLDPAAGTYSVA